MKKLFAVAILSCSLPFAIQADSWKEGTVIKELDYTQTNATGSFAESAPYSFVASIRNSVSQQTGTVTLPASTPYSPNPMTIVVPSQLQGAYYVNPVPFSSLGALNADFPDSAYTFNIARTYSSGTTTSFAPQVVFNPVFPYPSAVPSLGNTIWSNGMVVVTPNNQTFYWNQWTNPYSASSTIEFELWGTNGSGGSEMGSGSTSLTWPFTQPPGAIYQATLSFWNVPSEVTIVSSNDPAGPNLDFKAVYATVLHFTILIGGSAPCSYSVQNYPTDWDFNDAGGYGLIAIAASNSCCWSVTTTDSWIQVGAFFEQTSGCGSGTVAYTVQQFFGSCNPPRTGTIFVDGQSFSVTQVSTNPPCVAAISPTNVLIDAENDGVSIAVTQTSSCCWVVQNTNNWIDLSTSEGFGSQSISCSTLPNFTGSTRTGTLVIAGQTLTVIQPPSTPLPASLNILQAFYGANGSSNNVLSIIQANIVSNSVDMSINNSTMGGDPASGHVKALYLLYQNYNGLFQETVTEGGVLQIPNTSAQELPMGYTQWTTSKFSSAALANANISGPLASPSGDGTPNLMAFALGIDPNVASTVGLPQMSVIATNGGQFLSLSYSPNPYATNLAYTVEVSSDLISWNSGSGYTVQITPNGQVPVVVIDSLPMSANAKRFMHLHVSQTGP